jgi:resuscitation-promoting factor RpfA
MAMKPTDQEIGSLYREAGATSPSAELDRNILAAARAAVEKPAAPAPWWRRWRLPLQAAISACLLAMLTVMLMRHEPAPPAVPPLAMNQAEPAAESRQLDQAAPSPASKMNESRERTAPQQMPARSKVEAKPATAAAAPSPTVPAELQASSERALAAAPSANLVAAESGNAAGLAKAEARAAPSAKTAARVAADEAMSPKAWLDSIQLLIDQKRLDEARKRLEAFTQAYPGEPVPEGMRAKLKAKPDAANAKPQ